MKYNLSRLNFCLFPVVVFIILLAWWSAISLYTYHYYYHTNIIAFSLLATQLTVTGSLVIFCYVLSIIADPGRTPNDYVPDWEQLAQSKNATIASLSASAASSTNDADGYNGSSSTANIDIGNIVSNSSHTSASKGDNYNIPTKKYFCLKCEMYKPTRAHHCRECNKCTLRMDHHW